MLRLLTQVQHHSCGCVQKADSSEQRPGQKLGLHMDHPVNLIYGILLAYINNTLKHWDYVLWQHKEDNLLLQDAISQVRGLWKCEALIPPLDSEAIRGGTKKNSFQVLQKNKTKNFKQIENKRFRPTLSPHLNKTGINHPPWQFAGPSGGRHGCDAQQPSQGILERVPAGDHHRKCHLEMDQRHTVIFVQLNNAAFSY